MFHIAFELNYNKMSGPFKIRPNFVWNTPRITEISYNKGSFNLIEKKLKKLVANRRLGRAPAEQKTINWRHHNTSTITHPGMKERSTTYHSQKQIKSLNKYKLLAIWAAYIIVTVAVSILSCTSFSYQSKSLWTAIYINTTNARHPGCVIYNFCLYNKWL